MEQSTNKTVESDDDVGLKRMSSFRKIIPGSSDDNLQMNSSVKMIDRPIVSQNNNEYMVYLQEYSILSEYNLLQTQDLRGIYVIPSAQTSFLWFGVLFVRQGDYKGGVFRFTINLPDNFPDGGCPKVVFQSEIFHPQIDEETKELNTLVGFSEWKKNNRIYQLIQFICKIFQKIDTKLPAVNKNALDLYENNIELYRNRVKQCVQKSLDHVFDPPDVDDQHYIQFNKWNSNIYESIRQKIYEPKKQDHEKTQNGYSWVQPGSLQPLSKHQEPR